MRRPVRFLTLVFAMLIATLVGAARQARPAGVPVIDVTVQEGTSMSVAISPDGRTLAIDLQGGIWTMPAGGGAATRVTGIYEDARQPTWSPDGKWITYFSYKDGGYDLWNSRPTARASIGSRGAPSTIASRSGRTTAPASRSRRTAATRSAATTTSGCSTRGRANCGS